jgi:hypothetical protein
VRETDEGPFLTKLESFVGFLLTCLLLSHTPLALGDLCVGFGLGEETRGPLFPQRSHPFYQLHLCHHSATTGCVEACLCLFISITADQTHREHMNDSYLILSSDRRISPRCGAEGVIF